MKVMLICKTLWNKDYTVKTCERFTIVVKNLAERKLGFFSFFVAIPLLQSMVICRNNWNQKQIKN